MTHFASIIRTGALASIIAMAAPVAYAQTPSFTLNPSAVLGATNAGGSVTADQANIQDYSTVTFTGSAGAGLVSFTDTGFLPVTNFTSTSGSIITPALLNAANGYGLYFQFSASGVQSTTAAISGGATLFGATFTSLSYSLYAFDQGGTVASFGSDGTTITNAGSNKTLLASGSLLGGNASIVNGVPGANVFATVGINPSSAGVFVAPSPFYIDLEAAFINTSTEVTTIGGAACASNPFGTGCGFQIVQGGGSVTFVPEPATLAILGVGLAGLGLARRRARA